MKSQKMQLTALAVLAAGLTLSSVSEANSLKIGVASEPTSIDPHYFNSGPNNAVAKAMFNPLISQNFQQKLLPGLATSWKAVDDKTWEFTLREGVTFHDGTTFTANDFVYTACRVSHVPNSPGSFASFTKGIESIEMVDDYKMIIRTPAPYPSLPIDLSKLDIISAKVNGIDHALTYDKNGCGITNWPNTSDFNSGKILVGTGPYKLQSYTKGDSLVMVRNEDYWGGKPEWTTVTLKPISNAAARVAALLTGDVDFIDQPPTQDLPRLEKDEKIDISSGLSNRIIYLHMDQYGPTTPGVKGTGNSSEKYEGEGPCAEQRCEKNPFLDKRVRHALSMAIDREAIVQKIMGGKAVAAGELLPVSFFGANPDTKPQPYDPEKAKQLLAEAGYPNGFELTLATPNDRYINDSKIAQAIAQMFTRIGVKTNVDAMTKSVFFSKRNNYEFSIYLAGWGSDTGEMSSPLEALVASRDKERGLGSTNRGRYSNPAFDDMVVKAMHTVDDGKREKLLQQASRDAMSDYAILPLHFEVTSWAHRKGLTYQARSDQHTRAAEITSAP